MQKVLSNAQMREADGYTINALKISSEELMRRAGKAIAEEVASLGKDNITVVCGAGNNGGDGYVCARELINMGFTVNVLAVGENLSADCQREKSLYNGPYTDTLNCGVIVDCLFGTGLSRPLEGVFKNIVQAINLFPAAVVSADIPSGINGDNGLIMGAAVKADITVAIGEYKLGHFLADGSDCCGKLVKRDIGISALGEYAQILEEEDIKPLFPARKRNSNKGSYGSARLIVGCDKYVGAAALSGEAALKSGCGYVKMTTVPAVKNALAAALPQIIFCDNDLSDGAIAIGCGCGKNKNLYAEICKILKNYTGKLIIDADGLNALAEYGVQVLKSAKCAVALIPHVKEFSRLSGLTVQDILADPVTRAKDFAKEYGVILLLKSSVSVLTDGEKVFLLNRGNSSLSKGGSGDMLAGFACGTAARGVDLLGAVAASSYIMGMAAEICSAERTEYCVTANDIIKKLHLAVLNLTK